MWGAEKGRLAGQVISSTVLMHVSPSFSCPGYDVIAQAQSGTGKTATFAISILQQIELDLKATQALVLAPTRELAQQVREEGSRGCGPVTSVWLAEGPKFSPQHSQLRIRQ